MNIYSGFVVYTAYYVEINDEVADFDILREVQLYVDRAVKDVARTKYVFETHFHADFVSGHLDLKNEAGAEIVFGPLAKPIYEATMAHHGKVLFIA
ncbi:hypothetical protein ML462_14475 [Gramella lutea]|uniref:MBL fold metallo-hydrolase n=1 Tax=Christiangramia lutea TaxID=1607951 RepID=A0A9X1V5T2_9FLAO|nr:hypothetical protein [Christiangramia lutea]MCH4824375.1 hypothetical protein [Christiangramia lutea]